MYTDPTGHYTQGKVLSYVEGQKQSYDPDAWELQQYLIKLVHMKREDIPAGEEGFYGPKKVLYEFSLGNMWTRAGKCGQRNKLWQNFGMLKLFA